MKDVLFQAVRRNCFVVIQILMGTLIMMKQLMCSAAFEILLFAGYSCKFQSAYIRIFFTVIIIIFIMKLCVFVTRWRWRSVHSQRRKQKRNTSSPTCLCRHNKR